MVGGPQYSYNSVSEQYLVHNLSITEAEVLNAVSMKLPGVDVMWYAPRSRVSHRLI